jgi:hypothetical protein
LVQAVAKALCGLPTVKPGVYHCPADIGLDYNLSFSTKAQYFSLLSVPATGCQWVDGLGSTRSVTSSFWHTLGKAMGLAKPSYASFSGNRGYG